MLSRKLREGSVGLLILLGLGLFGATILWLRGIGLGKQSYRIVIEFTNVADMQVGAPVRYRGVKVGRITDIKAGTNGVDVEVVISPADLVIPNEVLIEANQGGLIGETSIDITPLKPLPPQAINSADPLATNCNSDLIICNRERLQGQIGVNFDELIRGSIRFTNLFSDPAFFNNLNSLVKNTTVASAEITQLTREINELTQSVEKELGIFSTAAVQSASALGNAATQIGSTANQFGTIARQIGTTANQYGTIANDIRATAAQIGAAANEYRTIAREFGTTANQVGATVNDYRALAREFGATANQVGSAANQYGAIARDIATAANQIGGTVSEVSGTVNQFSSTARELNLTAQEVRSLISSVNDLVETNRGSLVTTLTNINQTSEQLRTTTDRIAPILSGIEQEISQIENSALFTNLDTLSANAAQLSTNAAQAAANLAQVTDELLEPTNLLLLQQTLDSARATFQNAQKITSDLEQLTGDPDLRETIRNIIQILGDLLSSTEQLQQHTRVAQSLVPLSSAMHVVVSTNTTHSDRQESLQEVAQPNSRSKTKRQPSRTKNSTAPHEPENF